MAKFYFYYSSMNAGKTTTLLQSAFNYEERGMNVLCFLPKIVHDTYNPNIESRIGIMRKPTVFSPNEDLFATIGVHHEKNYLGCVLIDEGQFLTKSQVYGLTRVVDELNIPVLVYGLRTDFRGELFPGSHYLLAWADELIELKTICFCGKKATMTARLKKDGSLTKEGEQVACGGNDLYVSLCRYHYKEEQREEKKIEESKEFFIQEAS